MVVSWRHLAGFFWAAYLAGSLGCNLARAEPVADATVPPVVEVVATGEASTTSALEQLVRELVAELPVRLAWSDSRAIDPRQVLVRHAGDRRVVVRAWVDLSDKKRAKIYVANGESERFIVRFIPEPSGYDAVAREALGQILESSIAAFVTQKDAGIAREDAVQQVADANPPSVGVVVERPPEKPRPAQRTRRVRAAPSTTLELGLAYRGAVLDSAKAIQHGVVLSLGAAFGAAAGGPRFVLGASAGYLAKTRLENAKIGLGLSAETARVAAGLEGDATRRLALGALLGGGLDVVSVEPIERSAATRTQPSSRDIEPFLSFLGTVKYRLTPGLGLLFAFGTELDLSRPIYDVEGAGGVTPVFTPWLLRPTVVLGLFAQAGRRNEIQ